ncbi:MAG: phage gp6-like head-tail connector protein [Alphaproteobacteria bacterium]|nr:phage gp6-like head-tail connector protein [Alphaproteobacteria bacterium]
MAFGDLTTLADVKAWLQTGANPYPSTDDLLLTRLIGAASGFIQSWLGRQIASGDWFEQRNGAGGRALAFANVPVTQVLSVTIDGLVIPPVPIDGGFGAGYLFTPTELVLRGYVFTRGVGNIQLIYTAGFALPPPEIAQACIELVAQRYKERSRVGEVSKALGGGETVSFSQKDMSDDVKTILQQYRAVAPVFGMARRPAQTATNPSILAGAL